MDTFDIKDEDIIKCIINCANQMNEDEEMYNAIKILIDFMQFKNAFKNENIFIKIIEKKND